MNHDPLLGPVIALVAWSLVMLFWLAAVRAPYLRGRELPDGARGADLERANPGKSNWPAHNYMHLMEQPTLFYAIVLALVAMGAGSTLNLVLAWRYVAFRVAHSIVQATTNVVRTRFLLFLFATACLVGLTIDAALRFIG